MHAPIDPPLILLYHSIERVRRDPFGVRVSPRRFAKHMAVLRAHANPLSLVDFHAKWLEGGLPARAVVVTFDDGYADNLHRALPAMTQCQVPATIFIATAYIDSQVEYWWDELERLILQPGHAPARIALALNGAEHIWSLEADAAYSRLHAWKHRHWRAWDQPPTQRHRAYQEIWRELHRALPKQREAALAQLRQQFGIAAPARRTHRALTMQELRTLASSPLIEIGAHTVTHPSLGFMPLDVQRREILESKEWLEACLDQPITSFSYPFGTKSDYGEDTMSIVKGAGFARACSNFGEPLTANADCFQFPRRVVLDWSGKEFMQRLHTWFGQREVCARTNEHISLVH